MPSLSAVVLSKNEAKNIEKCLKSLQFCDEIIVIDDFSTDNTVFLAKKLAAKVYKRNLDDNFAAQRNFGLKKATSDWVLFLDSDERVSPSLTFEIKKIINYQLSIINYSGFYIKRQDYFLGKKLRFGETGNIKLLRLAKKNAGRWVRPVHEVWKITGKIGELQHPLLHFPHPTISQFLHDINNYTDIEAKYRRYSKFRALLELIFFPPSKFVFNYIIRLGFLDGIPGLIMALMMSYHSLLVRIKILNLKS